MQDPVHLYMRIDRVDCGARRLRGTAGISLRMIIRHFCYQSTDGECCQEMFGQNATPRPYNEDEALWAEGITKALDPNERLKTDEICRILEHLQWDQPFRGRVEFLKLMTCFAHFYYMYMNQVLHVSTDTKKRPC